MDFYEAFSPIFVFLVMYIIKQICFRVDYCMIKFVMCLSVIVLTIIGESHFDVSQNNDAPIWLMAIPISAFLIGQALMDALFYYQTTDIKKRVFFCLDNPLKKVWIFGNILATIVYCFFLFYWLWVMSNNEKNYQGFKEDIKVLNLSLGSYIFYSIFLIERVGQYLLTLYQS